MPIAEFLINEGKCFQPSALCFIYFFIFLLFLIRCRVEAKPNVEQIKSISFAPIHLVLFLSTVHVVRYELYSHNRDVSPGIDPRLPETGGLSPPQSSP